MPLRDPPPDFRFTLNRPPRQIRSAVDNNSRFDAGITPLTGPLRWFQQRLWRLKWAECIILMWVVMAFGASHQPQPVGIGQIVGVVIVSPLVALMFLAMLKAFVFVIIISSTPIASIIVRQCVFYHDRCLATFCEEPITFGEGY